MLRDFVTVDETPEAIGDLLTMAGFELEGIEIVEGDAVLDIKVCSNRGDGLSVLGLAREVLAKRPDAKPTELYNRAVNRFPVNEPSGKSGLSVPINVQTPNCSIFAYRGFINIPNGSSPEWMVKRLRQAGQRPISLFVDLTNYVMLELGQPLHAYDLAKLSGPEIIVRQAKDGERLKTLNGDEHTLQPNHMVIADQDRAIGLAGIMGGEETEVDENTQTVLLEAAHFNNLSVRKTRKQLGLNTDASYRFERSVDPEGVVAALNRVRDLLAEMGHADGCLPGISDFITEIKPPNALRLRLDRANRLLGLQITPEEAERYLAALGFTLHEAEDGWLVTVPSWRADIEREEDLVEELGRVHGYEKIPAWSPEGKTPPGGVSGRFLTEEVLIDGALKLGFDQVMSHSIQGPESPLDAPTQKIRLRGVPEEIGYLRNSLLPGLAEAMRRNGGFNQQLFELGPIFTESSETKKALALLIQGVVFPPDRQTEVVPTSDFFALKGAVEALANLIGEEANLNQNAEDPRLHPTRSAKIQGHTWQGVLGQLHPDVAKSAGLDAQTFFAELSLNHVSSEPRPHFHPVSRTPSIRRDIAFLIDKSVPYAQIEAAVKRALGATLESVWLFDVYEGKGVPEGAHSLALALTLRKPDATFTDEEANQEREKVVSALAPLGAQPR
jgi:phenylalanyl-tRNA synthetase beta chain